MRHSRAALSYVLEGTQRRAPCNVTTSQGEGSVEVRPDGARSVQRQGAHQQVHPQQQRVAIVRRVHERALADRAGVHAVADDDARQHEDQRVGRTPAPPWQGKAFSFPCTGGCRSPGRDRWCAPYWPRTPAPPWRSGRAPAAAAALAGMGGVPLMSSGMRMHAKYVTLCHSHSSCA